MSASPDSPVTTLLNNRRKIYGPSPFNQDTVGKAWTAVLESHYQIKLPHDIPSHIVALLMTQLKIIRASTPFVRRKDSYDDAHGYIAIAEHCDREIHPEGFEDEPNKEVIEGEHPGSPVPLATRKP